jgi:hypothetical protein
MVKATHHWPSSVQANCLVAADRLAGVAEILTEFRTCRTHSMLAMTLMMMAHSASQPCSEPWKQY